MCLGRRLDVRRASRALRHCLQYRLSLLLPALPAGVISIDRQQLRRHVGNHVRKVSKTTCDMFECGFRGRSGVTSKYCFEDPPVVLAGSPDPKLILEY